MKQLYGEFWLFGVQDAKPAANNNLLIRENGNQTKIGGSNNEVVEDVS